MDSPKIHLKAYSLFMCQVVKNQNKNSELGQVRLGFLDTKKHGLLHKNSEVIDVETPLLLLYLKIALKKYLLNMAKILSQTENIAELASKFG